MSKSKIFKIIMTGEGNTGKTTLLHRFIEGVFISNTQQTIGVEFFLKEVNLGDYKVVLQIWDFGGQPHFRFLHKNYARGARGALLLFDLTRPSTLTTIEEWVNICRADGIEIPILLIGSKADLIEKSAIPPNFIESLKERFKLFDYLEVSSKTGENVDLAFEKLTREIIKQIS
ncbi:MAG: Rab family GTPase [Promethearchaeota archaeon]